MSDQWHVLWGNQPYGPCTSDQLRELVRIGRLKPTDQVCYSATQQWFAAAEIDGLFPDQPSASSSAIATEINDHTTPQPAFEETSPVPASRLKARRGPRNQSVSPLYWMLPIGGAVVMGLLTVVLLVSGRSSREGDTKTTYKRPDPVRPKPKPSVPEKTGPIVYEPPHEVPSFTGVDYSVADLNYNRGPRGEKLEKRKEPVEGLIVIRDGYIDLGGRFVLHGLQLTQDVDGNKRSEMYFWDGKRHGPYQVWHDNGAYAERGAYKKGEKHGRFLTHNAKGKLESDLYFFEGKEHGRALFWWPGGEKKSEGYFVNGFREGWYVEFHPNGKRKREGKFTAGKEVGLWTTYDENGAKLNETQSSR